jgi:hypothetical protein
MFNNPGGIPADADSMFIIGCHEPRFDRNFMQASHLVDFQPTRRAPFRQRHNLQNSNQYPDEPPTALLLKDEYTDMNKSRQQNNALSTLVENQHE